MLGWEGDIPEGVGGGSAGTTASAAQLRERFGILLDIDPLTMTGKAMIA